MANVSKHLQPSSTAGNDRKYQGTLVASPAKAISPKCVNHILPSRQLILGGDSLGHVASFLLKVVVFEAVRRISKARCPFIWNSVQALQILVYPPFSWIQRWAPLKFLVQGIQKLSMPLLFLSVTTTLSERSSKCDDEPDSNTEHPEGPSEENELASTSSTMDVADGTKEIVQENWLVLLFRELEKQGITLPERFTEDELRRFYVAANGDFSSLLSLVKKTIRWRETFHILTLQELDKWSHLVFWHGFDTMLRPCLVIRLGLACSSIPPRDRPRFGQAVVSQIDYGVVNLTNEEDPRITVLLDCHGISPFRFPMQMMRSFITVVQGNYPNRLGVLFVVRLPPVVRVIAQTFLQVLKPSTKQKLRFEGDSYKKTLAEFLQILQAWLLKVPFEVLTLGLVLMSPSRSRSRSKSRSRSRSRSRSPRRRDRLRSERAPRHSRSRSRSRSPYRRGERRGHRDFTCKNCRRPGHFAKECPSAATCNNCNLPGHFAAECTSATVCWNCKESGHIASECKNEALCHTCNKTGHLARDCPTSGSNIKLCNNCFKPGHIAVDCTNERACNNCRQPGHIARECKNDPVCNLCNVSGHVARSCPKTTLASEIQGGPFRDILCRICGQPGHISRNCMATIICDTCGGRGHMSYECPSARIFDRGLRRF